MSARPGWVDYQVAFGTPKEYKPPLTYPELRNSLEYPNMNSIESRLKPSEFEPVLLPCYEYLCLSSTGEYVVGTNDYTGRLWYGNIMGYENFGNWQPQKMKDIDGKNFVFHQTAESSLTGMQLVNDDTLIFCEISGRITLLSIRNRMRDPKDLVKIGQKDDEICAINAMDVVRGDRNQAVVGTKEGTIRFYDFTEADLICKNVFRYAHLCNITGISTHSTDPHLFVSGSEDRTILIWDTRLVRPASGIFDDHKYNFTSLYWTSSEENKELIVTGDNGGFVCLFDQRMPGKLLSSQRVNKNWINGFTFRKNKAVITSSSYTADVYEFDDHYIKKTLNAMQDQSNKDTEHPNEDNEHPTKEAQIIRAAVWTSDDTFNVVGWNHFKASVSLLTGSITEDGDTGNPDDTIPLETVDAIKENHDDAISREPKTGDNTEDVAEETPNGTIPPETKTEEDNTEDIPKETK